MFWILVVALGIALLRIPFDAERISNGLTNGYAGSDSDQWKVVEFLAGEAKAGGMDSLWVEYWMADSQSTIGTSGSERISDWFDYLLMNPFGVHNLVGTSPGGTEGTWEVVDNLVGLPDSLQGLSPVAMFGHYTVYQLP